MTSAVISVTQGMEIPAPLYRGVSEGTGMSVAADLTRMTLAEDSEMQACECCRLAEECTQLYVARVQALFCGRFVCGLCAEAIKEERVRMASGTMEEAVSAHMSVCAQFNRAARADPLVQLANVAELMRQILRKSSEGGSVPGSPGSPGSPGAPKRPINFRSQGWRSPVSNLGLARSTSCFELPPPKRS